MSDVCFEVKILAQKLLDFKNKNKLTYQEIGDSIGVDKSYLSRIVKLETSPSLPVISRLAEYMKVPVYTLLIPTDEMVREHKAEKINARLEQLSMDSEKLLNLTGIPQLRLNDILQGLVSPSKEEWTALNNILNLKDVDYITAKLNSIESILQGLNLQQEQRRNVLEYLKDHIL